MNFELRFHEEDGPALKGFARRNRLIRIRTRAESPGGCYRIATVTLSGAMPLDEQARISGEVGRYRNEPSRIDGRGLGDLAYRYQASKR